MPPKPASRRLRSVITGLRNIINDDDMRLLYIDGVCARLVVTYNPRGRLWFNDSVPENWAVGEALGTGPIVLDWPIVYDQQGIPIPYNEELRVIGNASEVTGVLQVFYDDGV